MVAQLQFDFEIPLVEVKKKRIRFKVPTYKKFYSIWQYDREKFRRILNMKLKKYKCVREDLTQKEILDMCYIRDNNGLKLRDSDEAHIFRAGTLQRIYEKVFEYTGVLPIVTPGAYESYKTIKRDGLIIYPCECQAEIADSWQSSIKERIEMHIKLLRLLRRGLCIEEAVWKLKN